MTESLFNKVSLANDCKQREIKGSLEKEAMTK